MKQPIDWHANCARNWERTLNEQRDNIHRMISEFEQSEKEYTFYLKQITEAIRVNKDSFDRDRFMVKLRKRKS